MWEPAWNQEAIPSLGSKPIRDVFILFTAKTGRPIPIRVTRFYLAKAKLTGRESSPRQKAWAESSIILSSRKEAAFLNWTRPRSAWRRSELRTPDRWVHAIIFRSPALVPRLSDDLLFGRFL